MIGFASLWPKALFVLVACGFALGVYEGWKGVVWKKEPITAKLVFISLFVGVWMFAILQLFVREAIFHYELGQLRPQAVESIEIGGRAITDVNSLSSIVHALNHAQWFAVNHGGWGEEVPFIIHLRSGAHQTYHVAQYFRRPGAVLMSMSHYDSHGRGTGWSNGYIFCPDLPGALIASGISLPADGPSPSMKAETSKGKGRTPGGWARLLQLVIFGFFTIGSLAAFYGITFGDTEVYPLHGGYGPAQPKWMGKIIGLPMVSMVAAGMGLRVVNALFDWPDPTRLTTIVGVWLALLTFGIAVLILKSRKIHARAI